MVQADLQSWVASGDLRRAASSLVVDYGSDVFATCVAMVRNRTAAEDLTQDIFSDAIRGLATFRGEAAPRTWLLSIARNRCIDYLRARKRDPSFQPFVASEDDDAGDPLDTLPDQAAFGSEWFADREEVARALEALPEGDRALVVLRFKNGLEYDELANAFGLRSGTVRMRVSRALARMRATLEPPETMVRAREGFGGPPPPPPAMSRPMPMGAPAPAPGGAPPRAARAEPVPSWFQRLRSWARGVRPTTTPIGDVGRALAMNPDTPSDALFARLGQLVEQLPPA